MYEGSMTNGPTIRGTYEKMDAQGKDRFWEHFSKVMYWRGWNSRLDLHGGYEMEALEKLFLDHGCEIGQYT